MTELEKHLLSALEDLAAQSQSMFENSKKEQEILRNALETLSADQNRLKEQVEILNMAIAKLNVQLKR